MVQHNFNNEKLNMYPTKLYLVNALITIMFLVGMHFQMPKIHIVQSQNLQWHFFMYKFLY